MSNTLQKGGPSRPTPLTFTRAAHPLPSKHGGWDPLHLTFRPGKLPKLPVIHSPDILFVLSCTDYARAVKPSKHSIKTLAWMGDAVLQLAATKATLLLSGFEEKTNPHLSAIRSGLTCNRTFSYLTASYRIVHHLSPTHMSSDQKRHADFFEAYIGAAWISATQTKDPDQIREIESYLSQLYKPKAWPALESLVNGHGGLLSAVRLEQALDSGSEDDGSGEVVVIDVPVVGAKRKSRSLYFDRRFNGGGITVGGGLGVGKRTGSTHAYRVHVQASRRHHEKKTRLPVRGVPPIRRSTKGESIQSPIILE